MFLVVLKNAPVLRAASLERDQRRKPSLDTARTARRSV
jgi:hypothetical protein